MNLQAYFFIISIQIFTVQYYDCKRYFGKNHYIDPCSSKKCNKEEVCVQIDSYNSECIPKSQLYIFDDFHFKHKRQNNENIVNPIPRRVFPNEASRDLVAVCSSDTCRHGECEITSEKSYKCHCVAGVTGENCDFLSTNSNPCSSNPCYSESACINISDEKFVCICRSGRSGKTCSGHLGPCQCINNGSCEVLDVNVFKCKCPEGFGGNLCQYKVLSEGAYQAESKGLKLRSKPYSIDICSPETCFNGGTCLKIKEKISICLCTEQYHGATCNLPFNSTNQSKNSQQEPITELCPKALKDLCLNGGVCRKKINSNAFTCNCKEGFKGTFCNVQIPFCEDSNRCRNGGTCVQTDAANGKCECMPKFKGINCEIGLECTPNPCRNNQPCLLIDGQPKCICYSGFSGPLCT